MAWQELNTYGEEIDDMGHVKSSAWDSRHYPGIIIPIFGISVYIKPEEGEHEYSKKIIEIK